MAKNIIWKNIPESTNNILEIIQNRSSTINTATKAVSHCIDMYMINEDKIDKLNSVVKMQESTIRDLEYKLNRMIDLVERKKNAELDLERFIEFTQNDSDSDIDEDGSY